MIKTSDILQAKIDPYYTKQFFADKPKARKVIDALAQSPEIIGAIVDGLTGQYTVNLFGRDFTVTICERAAKVTPHNRPTNSDYHAAYRLFANVF